MKMRSCLAVLMLFYISWSSASAQTYTSTVFGNVRDESGAALQAAEIQIIEENTQSTRNAMSGRNGAFVVSALPPGRYTVIASLAGFRKSTLTGVQLNVGGKTRLNLVLQVGSLHQSLVVESSAGLLQSDTSALSQVIDNHTMTELPLNERELMQLALLGAGSAPLAPESRLSTQSNSGVNVNGAREAANNFLRKLPRVKSAIPSQDWQCLFHDEIQR